MLGQRGLIVAFILLCAALLAGGIGYLLYSSRIDDSKFYGSLYFQVAVLDKPAAADIDGGILNKIAKESKSGYATLAKVRLASDEVAAGDYNGAIASFRAIMGDRRSNDFFVEYSRYMLAMLYSEVGNIDALIAVSAGASPAFKPYIQEIIGLTYLRSGNVDAAKAMLYALLSDESASAELKTRVGELNSYIG